MNGTVSFGCSLFVFWEYEVSLLKKVAANKGRISKYLKAGKKLLNATSFLLIENEYLGYRFQDCIEIQGLI